MWATRVQLSLSGWHGGYEGALYRYSRLKSRINVEYTRGAAVLIRDVSLAREGVERLGHEAIGPSAMR